MRDEDSLMQHRSPKFIFALLIACCCLELLGNSKPIYGFDEIERAREQTLFFENRIRPAFVQYCVECHSTQTEASGGLLLDSREGWQAGGDSGTTLVIGDPSKSRLLIAIGYNDSKLKMPPDGRLPQETIDAFSKWIADGAIDPRIANEPTGGPQLGLQVERAQDHWAYRPLASVESLSDESKKSSIDSFINARLAKDIIDPASSVNHSVMVRRLYFDLTGLPPPVSELQIPWGADRPIEADIERMVDRLIMSPEFGEHFSRKWMDVVRYAESITLRGFVLPQAWRYRDYLIQAFTEDRPFDQMIQEQVAGDLLKHDDIRERRLQMVATGFLALGNTNLETQDKAKLEMDYVDEQLEVIGHAFLGQTIGCARCHDHKFDPIPTRDYYAMAGIMRSSLALEHENVSKWIEQPLPLPVDEESHFNRLTVELAEINKQITALKKTANKNVIVDNRVISVKDLPGVVVDSVDAKLVGSWTVSKFNGRVIGNGYIHDENAGKGKKTATFEPPNLLPGQYEVRMAYTASSNRATNANARVFSADGEATVLINQQKTPPEDDLWISLGKYRFEKDGQAFVLVTNEQTDGHVVVDAVQFLPLDNGATVVGPTIAGNAQSKSDAKSIGTEPATKTDAKLAKQLKELESQKKKLESDLSERPRFLTIVEKSPIDIPIHIRGDVHNLGEVVPRGFLTALLNDSKITIPSDSSGRVEMARWLSSAKNPLTARVYANRVWSWLMGQGIVPSINNFGTTGVAPTHPELLDWLANELIQSGWSTKHLVRIIVMSDAYRRKITEPSELEERIDPSNTLYWRGHVRRLPIESIRDSMLLLSGELDRSRGGASMKSTTKTDYDYKHESTRRSIYQPLLRNSLPQLFESFDFADSSVSIGQRPRTTVATQALVLLNNPWVVARSKAAAERYKAKLVGGDLDALVQSLYSDCFGRPPTTEELIACHSFLADGSSSFADQTVRLEMLIQALFAAIDFRYLD